MAVLPEHQRKGLGDVMLKHLLAYIKEHAAEGEIYISLNADPPGRKLYKSNGFVEAVKLDETGMVLLMEKDATTA
jgi:GNAT superfamily N-acetyltransferase